MSYKIDLSELERDGRSITQELVRRFADAIDDGRLAPGEKLPPTRELARLAEVNPLTAARAYKRLRELGYLSATVGRGTFVRSLPPFASDEQGDDWQAVALPAPLPNARERTLQDLMNQALRGGPDLIMLGIGLPPGDLLPVRELAEAAGAVFAEQGAAALAYTDIEGLPALRAELGRIGQKYGFAADGEEIIVTTGGRQAIDLVARAVVREGDVVCVESPSFIGIPSSLEAQRARVIGIPTDADGLDVDALERVLARHPVKLVALQTVSQNPTGRHLAAERAERLLELARERSFFVLEDGVYKTLTFDGDPPPPLRGRAPGHVIHVDSLSKTVGGGFRLGWIAARGPVFNRLVALKTATDLNSSALDQRIAARYLAAGSHERLLSETRALYAARAKALLRALERHLPGEYDAMEPLGGHSLWLTLRRRVDERALYAEALRQGVAFTPGHSVLADESTRASLRLTFSLEGEERLDEGVRRLAVALRAVLRADRFAATAPVS
jgi:DNA-binding transcriptional MocR family regulator